MMEEVQVEAETQWWVLEKPRRSPNLFSFFFSAKIVDKWRTTSAIQSNTAYTSLNNLASVLGSTHLQIARDCWLLLYQYCWSSMAVSGENSFFFLYFFSSGLIFSSLSSLLISTRFLKYRLIRNIFLNSDNLTLQKNILRMRYILLEMWL